MKQGLIWFGAMLAAAGGLVMMAGETVRTETTRTEAALTLDEAVQIALRQNPDILRAIQEIERTRGVVIEVRAQALPQVGLRANYSQQDRRLLGGRGASDSGAQNFQGGTGIEGDGAVPSDGAETPDQGEGTQNGGSFVTAGQGGGGIQNKSWRVAIEARQVIYSGGQVAAAQRIAKFTEDASYYSLRDIIDRVISDVRKQFYAVLLNRALITVQEESIRLLEDELQNQQSRFEAGTVPRFNVLRAEVELANARPELIRARNNYFVSQLQLAKTLGINTDLATPANPPVNAVGSLNVDERPIPLEIALAEAKANRAFLKVQRQNILIEAQRIKVALAGYKPRVDASGGYQVRNNSASTDLGDTVEGWFFGIDGSWDIFDGFETHGQVKQARARLESARIAYDDSVRQVDLEVQQSYARIREARELIQSQAKNVESALEALRLARERLGAGAGTQLDVLDARVALTRARTTELQARHDYKVAMAEFDRATGLDTRYTEMFDDPLTRKKKSVVKTQRIRTIKSTK
jgi:outer membrane protein TolC